MKQDYEKLIRIALRAEEEPSKELDQKLMEKFKERDFMKKGKWNGKRIAAAVVALCVVLLGGTATVNAATDGGVEKIINKFFTSVIYSSDSDDDFISYQDDNGNNVVQSGKFEEDIVIGDVTEVMEDGTESEYNSGIVYTWNDDGSEGIHYETNSDKQHAIFKFKIKNDTCMITTDFEDWMDEEDKIWELRKVFDEYETKDNSQEYIKELEKIKKNSKESYVKKAIEQSIEDIKSGKTVYIDHYEIPASDVDKNAKETDKIVDAAWFMINHDNLEYKDDKAEMICDSVAGYEMKCKCTIKKNEEGNYYIDKIEPVK